MLQPSQLTDVASQYVAEIVDLRAFLAKAGVPVGTPQAIGSVALRVQNDRAFHRDLAVTLWMTTEGGDRQIGFADLLGVLAIASAGVRLASDAEEQDALTLLQFFKEIRRTREPQAKSGAGLDTAGAATPPSAPIAKAPVPEQVTRGSNVGIEEPPRLQSAARGFGSPRAPVEPGRDRSPWLIAGVCLLFGFVLTVWLYRRSFVAQPNTQQAAGAADSNRDVPPGTPQVQTAPSGGRDARGPSTVQSETRRSLNIGAPKPQTPEPTNAATSSSGILPSDQASIRPAPPAGVGSATQPNVSTGRSVIPPASVPAARPAAGPASAPPIPSSTLSKRLGSPALPQYASVQSGEGVADVPRHPRLLRRHPATSDNPALVAGLEPLDNPSMRSSASSATAQVGSVRPTALGIMAANVIYSPAPPYPVAASAAHVTGEVKLEAQIDRDGTVTYARVVSGPPLLRDAALNAVQQWRYRPYLSRGKAVPMTTSAVMDFQLP